MNLREDCDTIVLNHNKLLINFKIKVHLLDLVHIANDNSFIEVCSKSSKKKLQRSQGNKNKESNQLYHYY